jgi:hypothetical protein
VGLLCANLTPADDWPDELGSNIAGHDQALSTIVWPSARLGRARGDAVSDGLTELYNQWYFKQGLGEEVARATEIGQPLAALFCDLDHFKRTTIASATRPATAPCAPSPASCCAQSARSTSRRATAVRSSR